MNLIKNYFTKKMLLMLISCAIFFAAILGYKLFGKIMMNRYFDNMPIPAATISTAEVKKYNWVVSLDAIGTVQAINSVDLTTEIPGVIESIKFNSSDSVSIGDTIVKINSKTERA